MALRGLPFDWLQVMCTVLTLLLVVDKNSFVSTQRHDKEAYRKAIEEYHDCLKINAILMELAGKHHGRSQLSGQAVILMHQAGEPVVMTCNLWPGFYYDVRHLTWQHISMDGHEKEVKTEDDPNYSIDSDGSLVINSVTKKNTGAYLCLRNSGIHGHYQLDVIRLERKRMVSHMIKGREPADRRAYPEYNLQVYTKWQSWGQCAQCEKVSYRRRYGQCTVKKIDVHSPVKPLDVETLWYSVHYGFPCRSTLLPRSIASLDGIANRFSELEIKFCKVECPATVINITDKYGNIVETVNRSAGLYSLGEGAGLPPEPVRLGREFLYKVSRQSVVIPCPEKEGHPDYKKGLVTWTNGTRDISAIMVRQRTRGRVLINGHNELVIRHLLVSDSAEYSCYRDSRLMGVVELKVSYAGYDWDFVREQIQFWGILATAPLIFFLTCRMLCCSEKKELRR